MEVARLKCKKTVSLIFNFSYILIWAVHPRKGLLFLAGIWQVKNSEFNAGQTSVLSSRIRFGQEWLMGQTGPQFYSVNKNLLEPNHNIIFFFMLAIAVFRLQRQNSAVATKTICLATAHKFTLWLFIKKKKVCNLSSILFMNCELLVTWC